MTKQADESRPFNFRLLNSKKEKLEAIAAKNNRTLAGQLNTLCDECIEADEKASKGVKGKKAK
jgi:hypothetical protein